jgi:hypothetical protein
MKMSDREKERNCSRQETIMMVIGSMTCPMEKVFVYSKQADILDIGKTTKDKDLVNLFGHQEVNIAVIGKKIRKKDSVSTNGNQAISTAGNGSLAHMNMEVIVVILEANMLAITTERVSLMERVISFIPMVIFGSAAGVTEFQLMLMLVYIQILRNVFLIEFVQNRSPRKHVFMDKSYISAIVWMLQCAKFVREDVIKDTLFRRCFGQLEELAANASATYNRPKYTVRCFNPQT